MEPRVNPGPLPRCVQLRRYSGQAEPVSEGDGLPEGVLRIPPHLGARGRQPLRAHARGRVPVVRVCRPAAHLGSGCMTTCQFV